MTASRALRRATRRSRPAILPWLLTAATVAAQIAYPLVEGESLRRVTIASVVLFFLASVTHAWVHRGAAWAAGLVAITTGGGLLAEAVGVRTGVPFGDYAYSDSLGPRLLDVPVVVPLAWTMMAYPVLLAARRVTRRWTVPLAAVGLAGWDVFLDPQMVADGRWRWAHPTPALPGVPHVPLTNYAGWLLVALVLMALLARLPQRDSADLTVPGVLLAWTYVGSVVGNVLWFGSRSIALAGGLAMGVLVVPWAWASWQSRP
jgi:uncharacterized membrane protein